MSENIFFDLKRLKYVGKNVIIGKTVRIRKPEEVSIGDNTIIDDFTYISCAMEIGKNCHIASNVSISGGSGKLIMGDYSTVSNGSSIHCASSDYRECSLDLPSVPIEQQFGGTVEDVTIGDSSIRREGRIDYIVVGYVKGTDTNIDTKRNQLIEAIEEALDADRTRNGNALDTQIIAVSSDEGTIFPYGGINMTVRVTYQFTRGNT